MNQTDLSYKIFENFAEREEYDQPGFQYMLNAAVNLYEAESPEDLVFLAASIQQCKDCWEQWADDWREMEIEAKAQKADQDYLRRSL